MPEEAIDAEGSLSLSERMAFMRLPLTERRCILAQQAQKIVHHYEQETEWKALSGGDFVDYGAAGYD